MRIQTIKGYLYTLLKTFYKHMFFSFFDHVINGCRKSLVYLKLGFSLCCYVLGFVCMLEYGHMFFSPPLSLFLFQAVLQIIRGIPFVIYLIDNQQVAQTSMYCPRIWWLACENMCQDLTWIVEVVSRNIKL